VLFLEMTTSATDEQTDRQTDIRTLLYAMDAVSVENCLHYTSN